MVPRLHPRAASLPLMRRPVFASSLRPETRGKVVQVSAVARFRVLLQPQAVAASASPLRRVANEPFAGPRPEAWPKGRTELQPASQLTCRAERVGDRPTVPAGSLAFIDPELQPLPIRHADSPLLRKPCRLLGRGNSPRQA
jgi:hypothetical protein